MQDWEEVKAINAGIERILGEVEMPEIRVSIAHSLKTAGKRLRPLSVLLLTELNGGGIDKALDAALAMECIHTTSLIQDDIVDEGIKRRGEDTSHEKFGLFLAMVSGDYLISRAMMLISKYDPGTIYAFSKAGMYMAEGELLDVKSREYKPTEADYFACVRKKTAVMFESSFEMGARIAGAIERCVEKCRTMGLEFGMAYQIVDDLIEYTRIDDENKKSALQSFILPMVYEENMSRQEAIDKCMRQVEERIARVDLLLKEYPDCDAKRKLAWMVDLLRNYNGVKIK
ncbi:Geranylgeranyl pyrophosphate synthase [Methanocella conradii HZ254]|uniref:Geranylgeranyl pyrophosphate synthase n=1 Tax=Methanocella conradii (strain DSM 24694 / JCM 17849 / CGMCC 1.5162 / HZ254) TaxID=1041930 RepID=H8I929_METCZ|nr:polyprenyl synthetase family protein [Methanocella conradii]AFC99032.1 Geranylgeranyl pyrophosphate synthase [Methanocella conradii HZ254]MDI6896723.1 polyprenyl synthetase family protein [Methanocella conradii]